MPDEADHVMPRKS